jgi:hypothetical protein
VEFRVHFTLYNIPHFSSQEEMRVQGKNRKKKPIKTNLVFHLHFVVYFLQLSKVLQAAHSDVSILLRMAEHVKNFVIVL